LRRAAAITDPLLIAGEWRSSNEHSVVLDKYSRRILSWAISKERRGSPEGLMMALAYIDLLTPGALVGDLRVAYRYTLVTSSGSNRRRSDRGKMPSRGLRMVATTFQPCEWKWREVSRP
jgi:hypothetical protein